jgi:hypothetical protein
MSTIEKVKEEILVEEYGYTMTNEFDFTGSLLSNSGKVSIVSASSC